MVMTNTMRVYSKTNELGYVLTTPTGFNAENEHLPLIVYLHGAGERGDNLEAVKIHGIPKLFSADPDYHGLRVVTLSPQCPDGKVWDNLTEQLMYLIETIVEDLAIDRDRITLTGNSMGGFGTYEMGCSYPGYFAALAPICGGGMAWRSDALTDTPMRVFHGGKDDTVLPARSEEMVNIINHRGGNATLQIFPDVWHDSWTPAYETTDLIEWLASASRKG